MKPFALLRLRTTRSHLANVLSPLPFVLAMLFGPAFADTPENAQTLMSQGNFKEAVTAYEAFLYTPKATAQHFANTIQCLKMLRREADTDAVREKAVKAHADNGAMLHAVAQSYLDAAHYGVILAGEFKRGHHRGGGQYTNSQERDRVRGLQLLLTALEKVPRDKRWPVLATLADTLAGARGGGGAWKFQSLTDLTTLPDPGVGNRSRSGYGGGGGTTVDEKGKPVFYTVPETWDAAKNDGERWRWAINEYGGKSALTRLADYAYGQFGVQTMASYGGFFGRATQDKDGVKGRFAMHTLNDNETIAKTAAGVQRFDLPEDYQYLRLYRDIGNWERLGQAYANRRQYAKAADAYQRAGNGKMVDQITKNWGTIERVPSQVADNKAKFSYKFRNGQRVDFTAHEIDIDLVLADVKKHIQAKPDRLDWQQLNVEGIGQRIINNGQQKYVKGQVAAWDLELSPARDHWDRRIQVETPVTKPGAYLITATMRNGNQSRAILWVNDTLLVSARMAEPHAGYYYIADAENGTPVVGAEVEAFGYRTQYQRNPDGRGGKQIILTKTWTGKSDDKGQVLIDQNDVQDGNNRFQWLITARTPEAQGGRLGFKGFVGLWANKNHDREYNRVRDLMITDRPVYRPGQTVKIKQWTARARYDVEDLSEFAGKPLEFKLRNPKGEEVLKQSVARDEYGGAELEYTLPENAALGVYRVGAGSFRVEEYKKPEFEVTVEAPTEPVELGDEITATVKAEYYFGGPVTKGTAKIKVTRNKKSAQWFADGDWDWLYGPGYWWFCGDLDWWPGWHNWGCVAPWPWWANRHQGPPEIVQEMDVELDGSGEIPVIINTALAKEMHGNSDHEYSISAEVVDASRRTIVGSGKVIAARQAFKVNLWPDRGFVYAGQTMKLRAKAQTPDGKPVEGKGKLSVRKIAYDPITREPQEREVLAFDIDTNADGTMLKELEATQPGQYRLVYTVDDGNGHTIEGGYVIVVRGEGFDGKGLRFNKLELVPDKREYTPGETVKLQVNADHENSTVLMFVRPSNGVYLPPKIGRMKGKSQVIDVAVVKKDMPNFFVEAVTVYNGRVHTATREIVVPPEQRILNVEVTPKEKKVLPGAPVEATIKLTTMDGKPFVGQTVVSVYDKAVEYISGGSNVGDIRKVFWDWRRRHNPNIQHTATRFGNHIYKHNETQMRTLGVFGHSTADDDAQGLQGQAMASTGGFVGGGAEMAMADSAPGMAAPKMKRKSSARSAPMAMAMAGAAPAPAVFMDASAVPGGGGLDGSVPAPTTVRTKFADTAFWTGALETDANGEANIAFDAPENLTGWKVKTWAMGKGTRVGAGESDFVTAKNIMVRLQAPRFFVQYDEVVLSGIVHNYLDEDKEVQAVLELEGNTLEARDALTRTITVPAGGQERVDWTVAVVNPGDVKVTMKALTDVESDAMQMEFPVKIHGALVTASTSHSIGPDQNGLSFKVTVPEKRQPEQSRLEIRFSPTLAGAMVDAIPYLADYPYGCTEQTLSRFLPAVLAQKTLQDLGVTLADIKAKKVNLNAQEIGDAGERAKQWHKNKKVNPVWDEAELAKIVDSGLKRILDMQLGDGGWGWFSGNRERSSAHTTAYVVHGLQVAAQNNLAVPPGVIDRGLAWLQREQQDRLNWIEAKENRRANNLDAFVFMVLTDAKRGGDTHQKMKDLLYEHRAGLTVYGQSMVALAMHDLDERDKRDMLRRNIEQRLVRDAENQSAWLELGGGSWWYWYGSEIESHGYYLKLLAEVDPGSADASAIAKYLVNNRKNGSYWTSTRDTAVALEALSAFIKASGENRPDMTVEVLVDGKVESTVRITPETLFDFDGTVVLEGAALAGGDHTIEIRKTGTGPLYVNSTLTNFSLEDFIPKQGLEVKVERKLYKLVPRDKTVDVRGSRGQAVGQKVEAYDRVLLQDDSEVTSGDLIEVELEIESKNDYEYLSFIDYKPAGCEPVDVRSGYTYKGLRAYVEYRDDRVAMFVDRLARGKHSTSYRVRAEVPGRFHALPTQAEAMYAPELRGNSDEIRLKIADR